MKFFVVFCLFFVLFACQNNDEPRDSYFSSKQEMEKILEESNKILLAKEKQAIEDFIDRHNLDIEETGTGLRYQIIKEGSGPKAQKGMLAVINYRIRLLTGDEVYNSKEDGAKEFRIGRGGVETGLEEGILLLNKGDKAIFIMPAHLAHGVPGDGVRIPLRTPIVYDVELIDLK